MFFKVDAIYLYHVHFGSELDLLDFFPSNDGPDVALGDRYDLVRDAVVASCEHLLLLQQYLPDHPSLLVISLGKLEIDSVLILKLVSFLDKIV